MTNKKKGNNRRGFCRVRSIVGRIDRLIPTGGVLCRKGDIRAARRGIETNFDHAHGPPCVCLCVLLLRSVLSRYSYVVVFLDVTCLRREVIQLSSTIVRASSVCVRILFWADRASESPRQASLEEVNCVLTPSIDLFEVDSFV